ncbi:MAG: hypothetical protein ABUS48_02830 [Pseudomonadota bacterium]
MSQKAIRALANVIWDEIERNPEFAQRIENALGAFAVEFARRIATEKSAREFTLVGLMQEGGAELVQKKANKLTVPALRLVIDHNNLDPSGSLAPNAKKPALIEIVVSGAEKKLRRKAALDY